MIKISPAFLAIAKNAVFNSSKWTPVGPEYSLKDFLNMQQEGLYDKAVMAEVVETEINGDIVKRMVVSFEDASTLELRINQDDYEEGDKIALDSITCQQLTKLGQDPIVRFKGTKITA